MKKFYTLLLITVLYALGIVAASLQPSDRLSLLMGLGSLLHIPAYAGLAGLLFITARAHTWFSATAFWMIGLPVFVVSTLFGIMNEFIQTLAPGRTFSIGDMINNALGAAIALALIFWYEKDDNRIGR